MEPDGSGIKSSPICGLCSVQLDGSAKLLPCQSHICEACHRTIEIDPASSRFKCPVCHDSHSIFEKQELRLIKSAIADIQEKLLQLKLLDRREQINEFCDSICLEVMETVESAVNHLNELGNGLLRQINEYRQELLDSSTELPRIQSPVNSPQQAVRDLAQQVAEFSANMANQELETAGQQVKLYRTRVERLESQLKAQIFNEKVFKFKENHLFCLSADHLGRLVVETPNNFDLDADLKPQLTLYGHRRSVNQVLSLPNGGDLLTCSDDCTVKAWNQSTGEMLYEINASNQPIYSMALLPNGWLACGTYNSKIKIWSLTSKSLVRTLIGHIRCVTGLMSLPDGHLASFSWDNTIKIWNPYIEREPEKNPPLLTISGHDVTRSMIRFSLLSNGWLVTCSNKTAEPEAEAMVRVWRPNDGQLVKSVSTCSKNALALLVLSNDSLAVGFREGAVKIIDLVDENRSKWLPKTRSLDIYALLELPNNLLASAGQGQEITVWNFVKNVWLSSIATDHKSQIWCLTYLTNERKLVSCSEDGFAKIIWADVKTSTDG